MATIELSISSEDFYWKVTILCVMLVLMFLCEQFISNVLVKIVATILNTILLVNLLLSMVTDAEKDHYAMEKLKAIDKIKKECIPNASEEDEFILPDLSREKGNIRYPRTPVNTPISFSNDKIPVVYDLTDGAVEEIPEISFEAAIRNESEDDEKDLRDATFIIDSGCTHHVVNDLSLLSDVVFASKGKSMGTMKGCLHGTYVKITAWGTIP